MPSFYEGVADLDEESAYHQQVFYKTLDLATGNKASNNKIMQKDQLHEIIMALNEVPSSTMTTKEIRARYPSYFNWKRTYHPHNSNGIPILLKRDRAPDDGAPGSLELMRQVV